MEPLVSKVCPPSLPPLPPFAVFPDTMRQPTPAEVETVLAESRNAFHLGADPKHDMDWRRESKARMEQHNKRFNWEKRI